MSEEKKIYNQYLENCGVRIGLWIYAIIKDMEENPHLYDK